MIGDSGSNVAYSYNLNFSPTCIMRLGLMSDDTTGTIDDLSLTYDGNRLIKVTDDADPYSWRDRVIFTDRNLFTATMPTGPCTATHPVE